MHYLSAKTKIAVNDKKKIHWKEIVIATGSRPKKLKDPGREKGMTYYG